MVDHQLPNEFRISPVVLMPPARAAPNFGGIAEPYFVTKLLEHRFEPGTVTTGFEPNDYPTLELFVKRPNLLFVLVLQVSNDEFASFSFQITDRLLSCMKVNADIYWVHSASFQSLVKDSLEFNSRRKEALAS